MDPKKTGIIILEARKKLNMTQKDLADKLYVSDKAVSKWERGISHIKWHIMKKLKICFILKGKITI